MNKTRIKKLSGNQAKIALLKLHEDTYTVACGYIWGKQIDEAVKIAESYPSTEDEIKPKEVK